MATIGQKERVTQNRGAKLFRDQLDCSYLGDWHEREDAENPFHNRSKFHKNTCFFVKK